MAIYKRPNSKYYWFKFTFDGTLVQQSSQCANKRDALIVESAYRTQLALGRIGIELKKDVPTFETAADDFLAFLKIQRGDGETYRRNIYALKPLKAFFGKMRADQIKPETIEKYIVRRKSQTSMKTGANIQNDTISKELSILKRIFNRLKKGEQISRNPAETIDSLPANTPDFHVVTPAEEKLYLLACPPLLADVAALILETGMRCGEVYNLQKKDFRADKNFVQITKGKTKAARRRVYLTGRAKDILERRAARLTGENLFPHLDFDGNEATGSLSYVHAEVIGRLNLNFRIYDCRHTFASRTVEAGIDLVTLAAILGHTNLKMLTRYCHPSEAAKESAMLKMEKSAKAA